LAADPASLSDQELRTLIDTVPHWYHQIEIRPGVVTPGINETVETLRLLSLPDDASGQRVLDIGVRDGYFSFELERRGAEVLAIDYLDPSETGFPVAKELLGSDVEYRVDNVYRLDPDEHGTFDIALFLGVLYHLRDPLLALDRVWDVCNDDALLIVETQLIDEAFLRADGTFAPLDEALRGVSLMQFYPDDTLHGDPTNYWAPNLTALKALVHTAGFVVEKAESIGSRGLVHARKVKDPGRLYQRRLEKSTLREAAAAVHTEISVTADPEAIPVTAPAPEPWTESAEVKRLQHDLALLHNEKVALQSELAAARTQIEALEAPAPPSAPLTGRQLLRLLGGRIRARVKR
jgi:tRNA (mo5U34)-methyltransferase